MKSFGVIFLWLYYLVGIVDMCNDCIVGIVGRVVKVIGNGVKYIDIVVGLGCCC